MRRFGQMSRSVVCIHPFDKRTLGGLNVDFHFDTTASPWPKRIGMGIFHPPLASRSASPFAGRWMSPLSGLLHRTADNCCKQSTRYRFLCGYAHATHAYAFKILVLSRHISLSPSYRIPPSANFLSSLSLLSSIFTQLHLRGHRLHPLHLQHLL